MVRYMLDGLPQENSPAFSHGGKLSVPIDVMSGKPIRPGSQPPNPDGVVYGYVEAPPPKREEPDAAQYVVIRESLPVMTLDEARAIIEKEHLRGARIAKVVFKASAKISFDPAE
jgi:hypothetical protein